MGEERGFYLLTYDIVNDKRRAKIARLCEAVAERVQYSVFEGYFTRAELERLVKKVGKIMVAAEDSLRIYSLCSACRAKVKTHGQGQVTAPPEVVIV